MHEGDENLAWFKASASAHNGGCVEVARLDDGGMALRDSKDPGKAAHRFSAHEWECFLAGARAGEFDLLT